MKFSLVIFLLAVIVASGFNSGSNDSPMVNSNTRTVQPVPDVMGFVNVMNSEGDNTIFYSPQTDSFPLYTGFPVTVTSANTFEGGIFCNMDGDPDMEIVYNTGLSVQARNSDGSSVPGWPKTLTQPADGAPSYGDIDGDGEGEIVLVAHGVIPSQGGSVQAFEKNGSNVTGFPINHGYASRTPVLANLDGTGGLEIITNKRIGSTGEVWVYKGDGTTLAGWPKPMGHVPASSPAVGDINNDNVPEIVMEAYNALYVWHANGDSMPGFPFSMPNGDVNSYSSPVLVDVNGDMQKEIVFGSHSLSSGGFVYILKNDGTVMPNWPKTTSQWVYGPPAVGYVDGDNVLDVVVGDQVGSGSPADFVYAWNVNGTALTGFPIGPVWAVNAQVVLADIDNDNNTELIFDDNTSPPGRYLGYNHDGTPMSGWPMEITGSSFFSTPVLTDINRDGILDIAGTGNEIVNQVVHIYLWNTGAPYNTSRMFNPVWQYNVQHTGVYNDRTIVGIEPVQSNNTPDKFSLLQNYPNPFNPETSIKFTVQNTKNIALKVYDLNGREVTSLINQTLTPGEYQYSFDGRGLSSGVYFYSLIADGLVIDTKRMMLVK